MLSQKVSVDIWKMMYSSCSYLLLAISAWVLLRLVNACIYLPQYLKKNEERLKNEALMNLIEERSICEEDRESKKHL